MTDDVQRVPGSSLGIVARAVLAHPVLWPVAVTEGMRLAAPGWWRRWPPLPVPDAALWKLRMETAYGGDGNAAPRKHDVITFLRWCREMRRWRRV